MNYYFITGTSSGIGKAIVEELLLDENNFIFGFSRTNTLINERFEHKKLDLSNLNDVSAYSFPDLKDVKKIILINNAGTLGEVKHFGNLDTKTIITSFNVNLTSVALLCNSFLKSYQNLNEERIIINISSGAAKSAYDGWASYCATKAGLNMLTEVLEKEQNLKAKPIKVFAIAPGVVDTYMQDTIRNTKAENFSNIKKFHVLKNEGTLYKAKDVAQKLISMCQNTSLISGVISRIEL